MSKECWTPEQRVIAEETLPEGAGSNEAADSDDDFFSARHGRPQSSIPGGVFFLRAGHVRWQVRRTRQRRELRSWRSSRPRLFALEQHRHGRDREREREQDAAHTHQRAANLSRCRVEEFVSDASSSEDEFENSVARRRNEASAQPRRSSSKQSRRQQEQQQQQQQQQQQCQQEEAVVPSQADLEPPQRRRRVDFLLPWSWWGWRGWGRHVHHDDDGGKATPTRAIKAKLKLNKGRARSRREDRPPGAAAASFQPERTPASNESQRRRRTLAPGAGKAGMHEEDISSESDTIEGPSLSTWTPSSSSSSDGHSSKRTGSNLRKTDGDDDAEGSSSSLRRCLVDLLAMLTIAFSMAHIILSAALALSPHSGRLPASLRRARKEAGAGGSATRGRRNLSKGEQRVTGIRSVLLRGRREHPR